jgi:hypothetical protein
MSVIGGMLTSTFLTLVIIPVVYTLFDDLARKLRRPDGSADRKTEAEAKAENIPV